MTARIAANGVTLNVEVSGHGPALILLHGFTGSVASWRPHLPALAAHRTTVAIDMLGHGRSDAPADPARYGIEHAAADISAVLDHLGIDRAAVLGYSMGGRVALFLAATAPGRVTALIVESAAPGIAGDAERRSRAEEDALLADAIERAGVAAFVDRWERLPLFATQTRLPDGVRGAVRAQRLGNSARGLANSLRGLGQGVQPPLFDRLRALTVPALVIAGALDTAYAARAREMCGRMPGARLAIVEDAGHTVHLEQPERFQNTVLDFLDVIDHAEPAHTWPGRSEIPEGPASAERGSLERHPRAR